MPVINDSPHRLSVKNAPPVKGAPPPPPKPKGPTFSEKMARVEDRLRAGELISLTRAGKDRWTWDRTGLPVGKAALDYLRREKLISPVDPPLFPDQPGQTWGWKKCP